jgi:Fe-S-cluster containining protein
MLQYVPILSEYDKGNGVCRYLVNNMCNIYDNRPRICSTEEMYISYFKEKMTENEFAIMNMEACILIADYFNDEFVKQKMIEIINTKKKYSTLGLTVSQLI